MESALLWNECLHKKLVELGFTRLSDEPGVYVNGRIIVFFYVDDIALLATRQNRGELERVRAALKETFEIYDNGDMRWSLGIRILRNRRERKLWLLQDSYITRLVNRFSCQNLHRALVPITHIPATNTSTVPSTAAMRHEYLEHIGPTTYPGVVTRPDISFANSVLGSFSPNPSMEHYKVIRQLTAYLRDCKYLAIEFNGNLMCVQSEVNRIFRASSDASFANDLQTKKSTEGYLLQLFSGPVDWRARKQDTVTTSTTEAELLALSHAAKEIIAWNGIFAEILFRPRGACQSRGM